MRKNKNDYIFLTIIVYLFLTVVARMPSTTYSSLLIKLYEINVLNPVKMGLENTFKLYKCIGEPTKHIPIIHIAGTNGKGSVAVKVSEILKQTGIKTGY
jgi:dihydrofolate synthase/folylpolyglutamate synthase